GDLAVLLLELLRLRVAPLPAVLENRSNRIRAGRDPIELVLLGHRLQRCLFRVRTQRCFAETRSERKSGGGDARAGGLEEIATVNAHGGLYSHVRMRRAQGASGRGRRRD